MAAHDSINRHHTRIIHLDHHRRRMPMLQIDEVAHVSITALSNGMQRAGIDILMLINQQPTGIIDRLPNPAVLTVNRVLNMATSRQINPLQVSIRVIRVLIKKRDAIAILAHNNRVQLATVIVRIRSRHGRQRIAIRDQLVLNRCGRAQLLRDEAPRLVAGVARHNPPFTVAVGVVFVLNSGARRTIILNPLKRQSALGVVPITQGSRRRRVGHAGDRLDHLSHPTIHITGVIPIEQNRTRGTHAMDRLVKLIQPIKANR